MRESWMHVEIDRIGPTRTTSTRSPTTSQRVLRDVREAVEDWRKMHAAGRGDRRRAARRPAAARPTEEVGEAARAAAMAGRRPLHVPRLPRVRASSTTTATTYLRGRARHRARHPARRPGHVGRRSAGCRPRSRRRRASSTLLVLTKANSRSTVHRPAYLDYVGVKTFDDDGRGRRRAPLPRPVLLAPPTPRRVLRDPAAAREGQGGARARRASTPDSHAGKALHRHPRDLPARRAVPDAGRRARRRSPTRVLQRAGAPPAAAVRPPRHLRPLRLRAWSTCPATATTPRSASGSPRSCKDQLRRRVRRVHRPGQRVDDRAACTSSSAPPRGEAIRRRRRRPSSSAGWPRPPARGATTSPTRCIAEYGEERRLAAGPHATATSFPEAYKEDFPRADGGRSTSAGSRRSARRRRPDLSLYEPLDAGRGEAPAQGLPRRRAAARCPQVLPVLSSMGVEVVDERPVRARARSTRQSLDLRLRAALRTPACPTGTRELFQDAFRAVWGGDAEIDGFNALVLARRPDLAAGRRCCAPTRSTCGRAARRSARTTSRTRCAPTPTIARLLVQLFEARFDPAARRPTRRATAGDELRREQIHGALDDVASLDQDRILRSYLTLIRATLRTNYFQRGADGGPHAYMSFKLEPSADPRPARCRGRSSRSSSTRRGSRACTCASARSRAAACAGPTGATTSAPRCSAWSRRRWSRTP